MNKAVIVTGSRNHCDKRIIFNALHRESPDVIIHGGAKGADSIASEFCRLHWVEEHIFKADWSMGKRAGPIRNLRMIDEFPEAVVLAFPLSDSIGTWHCVKAAKSRGMTVRIYE